MCKWNRKRRGYCYSLYDIIIFGDYMIYEKRCRVCNTLFYCTGTYCYNPIDIQKGCHCIPCSISTDKEIIKCGKVNSLNEAIVKEL
jgi:hypothetical protein